MVPHGMYLRIRNIKKMKFMYKYLCILLIGLVCFSCKTDTPAPTPAVKKAPVKIPAFDQQSAYDFIEKQLSFGTRVPAHRPMSNVKTGS